MRLARLDNDHVPSVQRDDFLLDTDLRCAASDEVDFGDLRMHMRFVYAGVRLPDRDGQIGVPRANVPAFGNGEIGVFEAHVSSPAQWLDRVADSRGVGILERAGPMT